MCILEEVVGNEGEEGIRLRESGKYGVYREQSQFHMNVHVTNHGLQKTYSLLFKVLKASPNLALSLTIKLYLYIDYIFTLISNKILSVMPFHFLFLYT